MTDKIMEFIHRRFPTDQNWLTGNCYFFALILQNVFGGEIYYDVTRGHFMTEIDGDLYDWSGLVNEPVTIISWSTFDKYDPLVMERVIRDCIM